jgi:CRISPR-associated protein Csm4
MKCKIIYLKPLSTYRTSLRSDTLWGILCWAIRNVYGNEALERFIKKYETADIDEILTISSTYPYLENNGEKIPFFPLPLLQLSSSSEKATLPIIQAKKKMSKISFVAQNDFEAIINGDISFFKRTINSLLENKELEGKISAPTIGSTAITHNTIHRLKGGTLTKDNQGQLFHITEHFLKFDKEESESAGLFFLAKGDTEYLEGALRYLEHTGLGGDKGTGKGHFEITIEDFELKTPDDANAYTNLSLFLPKKEVLREYINHQLFHYKLEDRQGKISYPTKNNANIWKDVVTLFKEGAIFPMIDRPNLGVNPIVKQAGEATPYPVYHYGMGFMIKMKIQ